MQEAAEKKRIEDIDISKFIVNTNDYSNFNDVSMASAVNTEKSLVQNEMSESNKEKEQPIEVKFNKFYYFSFRKFF